ncbi:hypothetical protein BRADI_4g25028v3 [Brachypodium distachyon]|uniref:Uncharacterized protein n=1 Tax=Brachypodium distachyon TaxID=15368 RepID=A0A0Q3EP94_BRADI|nr:hypothetical protein BRADI_4g25028v3 [Brachypodium distachyon]
MDSNWCMLRWIDRCRQTAHSDTNLHVSEELGNVHVHACLGQILFLPFSPHFFSWPFGSCVMVRILIS